MPTLIPNPERDRGLNDSTHVWLHRDGSTTLATQEEIDEEIEDDEPTLA